MSDTEDYEQEIDIGDDDQAEVDFEANDEEPAEDDEEQDIVMDDAEEEDADDDDDEVGLNEPYGGNEIDDDDESSKNEVSDDSDDEFEEDDTNYEKFDEEVRNNYVQSVHPELSFRSNDEIDALSQVTRDENTGRIIKDERHQTIPILSKFEFTRIIGSRISQLAQGAKPLVELKKKRHDLYLIAEQELIQKKLPFIIMRPIPNGKCEYWKLEDLEIII